MKKTIWMFGLLMFAASASAIQAAISVDFSFQVETAAQVEARGFEARGDVLNCEIRMHGIEAGDCFRYAFVWKSPQREVFADSTYVVSKPAGECEWPRLQCYCADSKEKGCWRSRAYRTISGEWNGKTYRATGVWTVEVWRVSVGVMGGKERVKLLEKLGDATYEIE